MAIEVFSGTSIPRELATAAMEFLWAKWRTLHDTNDLTIQRLTEECSYELRANSIHMIAWAMTLPTSMSGEAIQAASHEKLAGSLLSQLTNPLKEEFRDVYRQVAQAHDARLYPLHWRALAERPDLAASGASDQDHRRRRHADDLFGTDQLSDRSLRYQIEVYEHLFRTAPDAMVIASPISNDVGHTIDGWVVMMNDRARQLLGFDGSIGNLRLTQLPQFASVDIWGWLYAPKSAAAATPVTTADFNVEIMRFPHVFGLRISAKFGSLDAKDATLVPDGNANTVIQPA